jgi:hypothetical protein
MARERTHNEQASSRSGIYASRRSGWRGAATVTRRTTLDRDVLTARHTPRRVRNGSAAQRRDHPADTTVKSPSELHRLA